MLLRPRGFELGPWAPLLLMPGSCVLQLVLALMWPWSKGFQGLIWWETYFGSSSLNYLLELSAWQPALAQRAAVQPQQRWPSWSRFELQGLVTSAPQPCAQRHERENLSLLHAPMKQTSQEENTSAFENWKINAPPRPSISKLSGSLYFSCVQKTGEGGGSNSLCFTCICWCWKYTSLINGILVGSFHMFCVIKK